MGLKSGDLNNLVYRIFEIDSYKSKMGSDAVHARQIGHCMVSIQLARLQHPQTHTDVILRTPQGVHTIESIQPQHIVGPSKHAKTSNIAHSHGMIFLQRHGIFGGEVHEQRKRITHTHTQLIGDAHLHVIQQHIVILIIKRPFRDGIGRWCKNVS